MSYEVKQGNIFGRVGKGLAQGLSEQVPKEIERARLSKGLEALSNESSGLTPFQRYSKLLSIPGITPQGIQSGAELLRQEGINQALINRGQGSNQGNPYAALEKPSASNQNQAPGTPSVTTTNPIEATTKPYIPKDYNQLIDRAGQLARENPALYQGDPQKAIDAAIQEDQQNQNINKAYQSQRQGQQDVQTRIENEFQNRAKSLNAEVPGTVFNEIRDKAIDAVNSGQFTEKQAADKYGKEIDAVSRAYKSLDTVGNWTMLSRSPSENKRELKSVRENFKERNDLENLADTYISKNGLSPSKAYYLAYPSTEVKELNNTLVKLPELKNSISYKKGFPSPEFNEEDIRKKTLEIAPKIAKSMGKDGSPLSVSEELQSKGYDPQTWLDYLNKNRKSLDLTERQARELAKPRNFFPSLNDNWLFFMSGLDNLVEQ